MPNRSIVFRLLPLGLCAAFALALLGHAAAVASPDPTGAGTARLAPPSVNRDGTYGPFATMRRAEEVAQTFRDRGCRAVAFHNGDGYYVRVSC